MDMNRVRASSNLSVAESGCSAASWVSRVPSRALRVGSRSLPKFRGPNAARYAVSRLKGTSSTVRAPCRRILSAIRLVCGHRYGSATRAVLAMIGFDIGRPRLPRTEDEWTEVADILHSVGLIGGAA